MARKPSLNPSWFLPNGGSRQIVNIDGPAPIALPCRRPVHRYSLTKRGPRQDAISVYAPSIWLPYEAALNVVPSFGLQV